MGKIAENEKKKEYLRGYRKHIRRMQRIEAELVEIRSMRSSMSAKTDGMPRASGQRDMSDYAAELDQLERNLVLEKQERIAEYKGIVKSIKDLQDENEMDVLFYRYITGLDWWEIAEKMKYSERQVHRFHGKALVHIEIP